jgi:hypothetical protein
MALPVAFDPSWISWTVLSLLGLAAFAQVDRWRRAERVLREGAERRRRQVISDRRPSPRDRHRPPAAEGSQLGAAEG